MTKRTINDLGYGLYNALSEIFPAPIIAKRAPTSADKRDFGQIWINTLTNIAYIFTSNGVWTQFAGSSTGTFAAITVTTGPNSITGTTTIPTGNWTWTAGSIIVSAGNITATAGTITAGGGASITGATTINTTGTAATTLGNSSAGSQINLNSPITALPGPVFIYTGAGVPSNGLALHVGDLYINTTAASATTRMYIATAASTWTNITCAA